MDDQFEETCIECLDILYSRRFADDELWIVYQTMLVMMHKLHPTAWHNPLGAKNFSDPWLSLRDVKSDAS